MVGVLQGFLDGGNEDAASTGFEVFDDIISLVFVDINCRLNLRKRR
jgi:hypothetical protein